MSWFLVALAESWRLRLRVGLPLVLGAFLGALYVGLVPPQYEARALLQLKAEDAQAPLLQHIAADGHREALYQLMTNKDLLADAAHGAKRPIDASGVVLEVLNDHLLAVGYRSADRANMEQVVDSIAFNFIQALLAPERMQLEQTLASTLQEAKETEAKLADPATSATFKDNLALRLKDLQAEELKLRDHLKMVNTSFGQAGAETLIWFAEPATLTPPLPKAFRLLVGLLLGGLIGTALGYVVQSGRPHAQRLVSTPTDAADLSGLPLVGTLPWLGRLTVTPQGVRVKAQGKVLNPADFSEVSRLQRAILRGLPGPLVLTGVKGEEGATALALMLAEKTASAGKKVILADLNLKNRTLSQWLGLGDGNWELPGAPAKGKTAKTWEALHPVVGAPNLLTLAAPRHPHTLQTLAEAGGLPVLFDRLSEQADVVIVDASPLAALNRGNLDAVAVAVAGGRTVLMAQATETRAEDLKRATDSLLLAGAPLLGVVLNQQFVLSRRQLLAQLADTLGRVLPFAARALRKAAINAKLD